MYGTFIYLSHGPTVEDLEHFIEAELAKTLHRVAKECGGPALAKPSNAGIGQRDAKTLDDTAVLGRVNLDPTFDKIERNDRCVSGTAAQDAAKAAQRKVFA